MRKFYISLFVLLLAVTSLQAQTVTYPETWGKAGFNLTESGAGSVQVVFSVPSFTMTEQMINGTPMKNVGMPGSLLFNDAGKPNLPGKGRYIAIPSGSTPKLRIVSQRTEVMHNVEIAPAPVIPLDGDDRELVCVPDAQVYSTNAYYPAAPVQLSEITQIRGVDAVIIGVTPFQYNPVTKDLIIYKDLKVEVKFEGGNGQFGNTAYRSTWWDPIMQDNIMNYAQLPVVDYNARMQKLSNLDAGDECEYIIICPNGTEFQAWADTIKRFRTEQGILTKVFTLTQVGGNTEAAIEAFIDDAYNNWTIKPAACLLLGDYGTDASKNIITHLYTHPAGYPAYASDNKYADVTGDEMPDVIFARMAAANATQLQVMISKFMNYERNPPTNPLYYDKPITALGWQTERWFQLCSEIVGGYFRNVHGKHPRRINQIYQGTPGSIWSSATNTNTIVSYFGPSGLQYIPQTPTELGGWNGGNATQINNAIDSGAFMLQHRDHGNYTGWGEPSYTTSNVAQLHNTDLTFVFSINCETGAYHNPSGCPTDCFQEKFQRHTYNGQNSGALGLVCPSETSYSFVNDTFVWGMYDNMWPDFMPAEGTTPASRGALPAFGEAAGKYFLKQSNWPYNSSDKQVTYRLFHMHGDAFQPLYWDVPQPLTVNHDTAIVYGSTTFSIQANDSAFIALTYNDEILATGYGSSGGPTILTIPVLPVAAKVKIVVTKQNYFRYTDYVSVTSDVLMAIFTANTTSICSGSSVDYTDLSSGHPTSWAWEFTGGTPATSTDQNPSGVVYSQSGSYDVKLTVTKDGSTPVSTIQTAYINVTGMPSPAFSSTVGCPGQPVQFTDESNPNGSTITSWLWNFGDPGTGSANTSTTQNPTHSYLAPGTYTVKLAVTVNNLCTDTIVKEALVTTTPGVAGKPVGETNLCKDVTGKTYTTVGVTGASTYTWAVDPTTAGTIEGTGMTGTLTLAAGFTGTFGISVQGNNDCGNGTFSETLPVTVIDAPAAPAMATGADSVNLNKGQQSDYTIAEVPGATGYAWSLTPATAGSLNANGLTATANWDKTYRGIAVITVKASNTCGESAASEDRSVTLYAPVGMGETEGLGLRIFPNPNNGQFSLDITSATVTEVKITLYDVLGNLVYSASGVKLNGKLHQAIDLPGLAKGVYRLNVSGNGISTSTSVVIGK